MFVFKLKAVNWSNHTVQLYTAHGIAESRVIKTLHFVNFWWHPEFELPLFFPFPFFFK